MSSNGALAGQHTCAPIGRAAVIRGLGFADCLQAVAEQGARRALIPLQNRDGIASLPPEILGKIELAFYTDPKEGVLKALGL